MHVRELGHVVLYVRDLDRSRRFYRDVLGFEELPIPGGANDVVAAFTTASHRTHHELLLLPVGENAAPIPDAPRVGMYHIGLKVGDSDDDLRQALAAVQAAGATVTGTTDHTVTHSIYIEDPDGNEVELYVDVPGVDWRANPSLIASPLKPLQL